jgi:ribosomal protein RSM22 (predicted rRNA methylase)
MPFPQVIQQRIENLIQNFSKQELVKISADLTASYKQKKWRLSKNEKVVYALCRMPATYAVIERLIAHLNIQSLLDVGAGPGTGSFALQSLNPTATTHSIEHDADFISLGKTLQAPTTWQMGSYHQVSPKSSYDLVLFSYSLGESLQSDLKPFWEATSAYLLIIEPGTVHGYQTILKARDQLIGLGAHIVAPCPHAHACPLVAPDWCHFGLKLQRSPLHRYVKLASLDFEEEKFSYLLVSKTPQPCHTRLLRPIQKRTGHIHVKLCTPSGLIQTTLTKKSPDYEAAKKAHWGDAWPFDIPHQA